MKREYTKEMSDTIGIVLETGITGIQEIQSEVEEWYDSMTDTSLENTEKYRILETAKDSLSQVADDLEEIELPESVSGLTATFTQITNARNKGQRLLNYYRMVEAVKDVLKAEMESGAPLSVIILSEHPDEVKEEVSEIVDQLETAVTDLEGLEFPS